MYFEESKSEFRAKIGIILRSDSNFRWYLVARILAYFGTIAFAFYAVYAVQEHHVSEWKIGLMTGGYLATQNTGKSHHGMDWRPEQPPFHHGFWNDFCFH